MIVHLDDRVHFLSGIAIALKTDVRLQQLYLEGKFRLVAFLLARALRLCLLLRRFLGGLLCGFLHRRNGQRDNKCKAQKCKNLVYFAEISHAGSVGAAAQTVKQPLRARCLLCKAFLPPGPSLCLGAWLVRCLALATQDISSAGRGFHLGMAQQQTALAPEERLSRRTFPEAQLAGARLRAW